MHLRVKMLQEWFYQAVGLTTDFSTLYHPLGFISKVYIIYNFHCSFKKMG